MQPNNGMGGQEYQQHYTAPNNIQQPPHYKKESRSQWIIVIVLLVVLMLAFGAIAAWAFLERAKYKNDVDQIVESQVSIALQEQKSQLDNEFREKEKEPLESYLSPAQFGAVQVKYPKTWSAYIDESGDSNTPVDGYLHPDFVPAADSGVAFALRVEVLNRAYDEVIKSYESDVKSADVTLTPYRLPNVDSVLGSRIEGEINNGQQGHMVVLPLRDKTLRVSTQANSFLNDFDNIILKNLTFTP